MSSSRCLEAAEQRLGDAADGAERGALGKRLEDVSTLLDAGAEERVQGHGT